MATEAERIQQAKCRMHLGIPKSSALKWWPAAAHYPLRLLVMVLGMPPQRLDQSPLHERLRLLQQLNHHVRLHPIFFPGRMLT